VPYGITEALTLKVSGFLKAEAIFLPTTIGNCQDSFLCSQITSLSIAILATPSTLQEAFTMPNNRIILLCPRCGGRTRFEEITEEAVLFRCSECKVLLVFPLEDEIEEKASEENEGSQTVFPF